MRRTVLAAGMAVVLCALTLVPARAGADADGSDAPPPGALASTFLLFKQHVYKTFGPNAGLRSYKFGAYLTAQRYPHGLRLTYKTTYDLRPLSGDEGIFYGATVRLSNGKVVGICERGCLHQRKRDDDAVTRFVIGPPSRDYVWEQFVRVPHSVRPVRADVRFACFQGDSYKGTQLCSLVKHLKGSFPRMR